MKRLTVVILMLILPFCFTFSVSALAESAASAVLIDGVSGTVLFAKNENTRRSMASTTKIMTALLLCESGLLDETFICTREAVTVEGTSMGLKVGDAVTGRDLLYGMLLQSGNDAANSAALLVGGEISVFVSMMNEKAAELLLENTHFVTPSGLDAAEHYSTASDMAKLARYAMQNTDFRNAASTGRITLKFGTPQYSRTFKNHNKLLGTFEGMCGVKTGYTKKSGRCLVSAAKRGSAELIAVTLSDRNDWADHREMLEYGFTRLSEQGIGGNSYSVKVENGTDIEVLEETAVLSLPKEQWNNIKTKTHLPDSLKFPVKKGDEIGHTYYTLNGEIIKKLNITAAEDSKYIEPPEKTKIYFKIFKTLFGAMK